MTTQRDRLAAAVHFLRHEKADLWPVSEDCGCRQWADFLSGLGIRALDADALSKALAAEDGWRAWSPAATQRVLDRLDGQA